MAVRSATDVMPAADVAHVLTGHGDDHVGGGQGGVGELSAPMCRGVQAHDFEGAARADAHGLVLDHMRPGRGDGEGQPLRLEHHTGHDRARRVARAQEEHVCASSVMLPLALRSARDAPYAAGATGPRRARRSVRAYRMWMPETARAMIRRWISEVPSKMV